MVKCEFRLKIGFKRPLRDTKSGSVALGGYAYDKDDHDTINIGYSAFGDNARLIDSLPLNAVISGRGSLKNSNVYSKDAKEADNNAREIKIFALESYELWNESTTSYQKFNVDNDKPNEVPKEKKQEKVVTVKQQEKAPTIDLDDDLPF